MNGLELTSVTPFNLLSNAQLERLSRHSDLIYLDQQQTFTISSQLITERCLLLIFKGRGQWQVNDED